MELLGVLATPYKKPKKYSFNMDSYKDFYPVLDCGTFDIVRRKFGNNYYDIYVDDNGLLLNKDVAIITFKNDFPVEILVGNCFVCKHNDEGDTISLTDEEVKEVLNNTREGVLVCEIS